MTTTSAPTNFLAQLGAGWRDAPLGPVGESGKAVQAGLLATYRGPGRDRVLQAFERLRAVPEGTSALARQADPITVGREVYTAMAGGGGQAAAEVAGVAAASGGEPVRQTLGFVASSGAARAMENPVYGGWMGQQLWLPNGVAAQAGGGAQRMTLGMTAGEVSGGGGAAAADAMHAAPAGVNGPALAWGAGIGAVTGLIMGRDNSGLAMGLGIGGTVLGATMLKGASSTTGYGLLGFGAALAVTGLLCSGDSGPKIDTGWDNNTYSY